MDDFGTDSLADHKASTGAGCAEIDQSFVRDALDANDLQIIRAIVAVARNWGWTYMNCRASESEQLDFLQQQGPHYQG
jgi:EAL domain-containing protein (putative c-di-GMP-specific phosphodiesterase class I)